MDWQSNFNALVMTRGGHVNAISTVIHDGEGNGIAEGHGCTVHFNYRDFDQSGYAVDSKADKITDSTKYVFMIHGFTFDTVASILGIECAERAVLDVLRMVDWKSLLTRDEMRQTLFNLSKNIINDTAHKIWTQSHVPEHSPLTHTTSFETKLDVK